MDHNERHHEPTSAAGARECGRVTRDALQECTDDIAERRREFRTLLALARARAAREAAADRGRHAQSGARLAS